MFRLIDNTLTYFDRNLPSKEELHTFCDMLFAIGVDIIEISVPVYERMESLPRHQKFILDINFPYEMAQYPEFYRYAYRHEAFSNQIIYDFQINDAREIIKLRALKDMKELRFIGLDNIMCHDSHEKILKEIVNSLPGSTIILCPENTYGCASAIAVQWAYELGRDVTASFAGCRNNAATEEVIMAMRLAFRHKPNRDLTILPELTILYERLTGKSVDNKKPIIGKNICKVEAGIHVDGILKNPATYEAYHPSLVGKKIELVIGKHSGSRAIKLKLEELGLPLVEEMIIEKILEKVKTVCTEGRKSLMDQEFAELVKEVIINEGDQIHRRYNVTGWGTKSGTCAENRG